MSLEFYRWLHIVSLPLIFSGLAGLVAARTGGSKSNKKFDRSMALTHGVGMTGMLVAGFGAMAKLGFMQGGWPWWIYVKLVIWLALGGSMTVAKRRAKWGPALLLAWVGLAALGTYLGIFKPASY